MTDDLAADLAAAAARLNDVGGRIRELLVEAAILLRSMDDDDARDLVRRIDEAFTSARAERVWAAALLAEWPGA